MYEHTSVEITANLDFAAWSTVFGDAKMATALLDRLTLHYHIVETGNESHRFLHSSATAKKHVKVREQTRGRHQGRSNRRHRSTAAAPCHANPSPRSRGQRPRQDIHSFTADHHSVTIQSARWLRSTSARTPFVET
jgi:hypothetical protein